MTYVPHNGIDEWCCLSCNATMQSANLSYYRVPPPCARHGPASFWACRRRNGQGLQYRWVCVEQLALYNRRSVAQCLTYVLTKVEPEAIFLSDDESDIPDAQPYPDGIYLDEAMMTPPRVHNVADTLIYPESAEEASMTHPSTPPELVPTTPPELVPIVPMMAPPLTPLGAPVADSAMESSRVIDDRRISPWSDSPLIGDFNWEGHPWADSMVIGDWAARARQFPDDSTIPGAPVHDSAIESSPLMFAAEDQMTPIAMYGDGTPMFSPPRVHRVADTLIYPDSTVESIPPDAQMPITSMEMEVGLDMEIIEDIIGGHDMDVDEVIQRIVIGYSIGTASTSRETS